MIKGKNITFSYEYIGCNHRALKGVDLEVAKGEFAVILGRNGCGKSTLCKHFNGLLPMQSGELSVMGTDLYNEKDIWKLRRKLGMVFQNPDNQFVSSVVEEDVAFGLENYQVSREEIPEKVMCALKAVGMEGFEKRSPHTLSGGQKQRVALAGVLALEPELLVFDEATAMLDPTGRTEVLGNIKKLHDNGKTIVMITHYIEEAVLADKIFLMKKGEIIAQGTPREILTNITLLKDAGLEPPLAVKMYYDLKFEGTYLENCPLTSKELVEEICKLV